MVDYLIWPWMERLPMFDDYTTTTTPATSNNESATTTSSAGNTTDSTPETNTDTAGITSSKFPQLYHWMRAMFELPAVRETMFDLNSHRRFGRSQLMADPEYDMGLENEPPVPTAARL